jgi:acyl-CoA synthetase (NDP forming)
VDFGDILAYLLEDEETQVVALYIEGLDAPRGLMEVAEANCGRKPVIAYKTGRSGSGDQASLSHTGSVAGRHLIYAGALRQAGVILVDSAEDLLDLAHALTIVPLPRGPRVAVLSAQAGPGMAACDVCEANGLEIVQFRPGTQAIINELLPPLALRSNPVDLGPAWYHSSALQGIVRAALEDENVDAVMLLMMFASANRATVTNIANVFQEWKQKKPAVACLVAPPGVWDEPILELEEGAALVNLPTPERAAKVMGSLWQYQTILNKTRR